MKIGIITQPLQDNYGGLLQNFALQTVIKRWNYDVITYDWKKKGSFVKNIISQIFLFIKALFFKKYHKPYYISEEQRAYISQYTKKFIDTYINKSDKIFNYKGFINTTIENSIDVLIVGSDQIWRPVYNNPFQGCMFLDFVKNKKIKRIAYAASFGTDKWEFNKFETRTFSDLLTKFDLVSVREDSGVELCKKYFNVEATHVLDPTMLLNKEDYIRIVEENNETISLGNLFYYILDPSVEKTELLMNIANILGLKPFTVMAEYTPEKRTKENVKNELEKCVFPSVTKWLRSFMDAEMVVCDSFHGCVFSIIFNKPFWVISNKYRGNARFDSLLRMFHLENRFIDINTDISCIDLNAPISWPEINYIREAKGVEAQMLLFNAIKYE